MRIASIALVASLLFPTSALAGAYKCVGANGKVTFQQQPCPATSTQSTIQSAGSAGNSGRVQVHSEERTHASTELANGSFVWFVDRSTIAPVGRFKRVKIAVERNGKPHDYYYRYFDCSKPGSGVSIPIYEIPKGNLSQSDAQFRNGEFLADNAATHEQLPAGRIVCGGSIASGSTPSADNSNGGPTVQRTLGREAGERCRRALNDAGVIYTIQTNGPDAYVFTIEKKEQNEFEAQCGA